MLRWRREGGRKDERNGWGEGEMDEAERWSGQGGRTEGEREEGIDKGEVGGRNG